MKKINKKLLAFAFMGLLLVGCGTTVDDEENDDIDDDDYYETPITQTSPSTTTTPVFTTPTTVVSGERNGLHVWNKPRVFAKSLSVTTCNGDKIFSLRPHQNTLKARLVDFTATNVYLSNYKVQAVNVRNPNAVLDLTYDSASKQYLNECANVTYVDKKDIYPSYWVQAVDVNGSVVTRDKVTMYDGGDQNCIVCHASTSQYPLAYGTNPANNIDSEVDYKTNILRIHDTKHGTGLEQMASNGVVSCTSCHGMNGVVSSGQKNYPTLTNAMHRVHVNQSEPNMIGSQNCLTCHPGETIQKTFTGNIVHPFTSLWRSEDGHGEWAENNGVTSCKLCHGMDLRGTQISNNTSCYQCHGQEW
ncbi:MAG: hypothetical protein Q9M40_08185 [Sulfurimonas sp.]|nr:hypothetical protein [Sulfurimonas sp.]